MALSQEGQLRLFRRVRDWCPAASRGRLRLEVRPEAVCPTVVHSFMGVFKFCKLDFAGIKT